MAYFSPGIPNFTVTNWAARAIRDCQSAAASTSRVRYASQIVMQAYGAAFANASTAPTAPTENDGAIVGADPTSTWNPGLHSRIICMTFSMLPELSLMAMIFGCSERRATTSGGMSIPVACGQL